MMEKQIRNMMIIIKIHLVALQMLLSRCLNTNNLEIIIIPRNINKLH